MVLAVPSKSRCPYPVSRFGTFDRRIRHHVAGGPRSSGARSSLEKPVPVPGFEVRHFRPPDPTPRGRRTSASPRPSAREWLEHMYDKWSAELDFPVPSFAEFWVASITEAERARVARAHVRQVVGRAGFPGAVIRRILAGTSPATMPLRQALHDRGLADAGLTDQHRVVLGATGPARRRPRCRCARPSTIAVLPTPGSPISTGLFLVGRQRASGSNHGRGSPDAGG